jgi:thioesterase domain-containing protein
MATFALVHGAWFGGWCWRLVVDELVRRGHRANAVDLPAADPAAGADSCADVVVDSLAGSGDDVVVVGHSMGGLVAPLVAARLLALGRPVRRVVFVAGLLPLVGSSFDDQVAAAGRGQIILPGLGAGQLDHGDGSSSWADLDKAADRFCPDAPPELAAWATRRLRRQYWTVMREISPLSAWPDVDYTSIVCVGDRTVSPAWGRQAFRDRFHAAALELPGDHSPFLARPVELVDLLVP